MTDASLAAGATFVALGIDISMMLRTAAATAAKWRGRVK